jgi:hypothetical protein
MWTEKMVVAGIELQTDGPTTLTFQQLFQWVIWQYPLTRQKGFCGAVRPPETDQEWIPAIIQSDNQLVDVYAHVGETFSTPETAVEYFSARKKAG